MKNKVIRVITTLFAIMLTARGGIYNNPDTGLTEKYYNKPMGKVVQRAQDMGIPCEYWERADGVKCFGPWVIVAAHPSVTRYTFVETSRGTGIVLDRHTVDDTELIDIATTW